MKKRYIILSIPVITLVILSIIYLTIDDNFSVGKYQVIVPAKRGAILSELDNTIFACDSVRLLLAVDPFANRYELNLKALSDTLSIYFPKKTAEQWLSYLREGKKNGNRYIKCGYTLDPKIYSIKRHFGLPVIIDKEPYRYHIDKIATSTIGIVPETKNGSYHSGNGLEMAYYEPLRGSNGLETRYIITMRKPFTDQYSVIRTTRVNRKVLDGKDIHITLDMHMQQDTYAALKAILKNNGCDYGTILISDTTGSIHVNSNLCLDKSGEYSDIINHGISYPVIYSYSKSIPVLSLFRNNKITLDGYCPPVVSDVEDNFEITPVDLLCNVNSTLVGKYTKPCFISESEFKYIYADKKNSVWERRISRFYGFQKAPEPKIDAKEFNQAFTLYDAPYGNYRCISDSTTAILFDDLRYMNVIAGISKKYALVIVIGSKNNQQFASIVSQVLGFIASLKE